MDGAEGATARREQLLQSARVLLGEAGPDGAVLMEPRLAAEIAGGMAADAASNVRTYSAGAETPGAFAQALVDAVVDASAAWADALVLGNMGVERLTTFEDFERTLQPLLAALQDAIVDAQGRGVVRDDLDPATTALVLRDALDRTAKASVLFRRDAYPATAATLVQGALRA